MEIKLKNKKIELKVKKVSELGKFIGLMFKTRNTENLFFEFKRQNKPAIHSFFVFFTFLAIWLDERGNVAEFEIVKPFTFSLSPRCSARKLIEIPINEKNKEIVQLFVGKRKV